MQTTETILLCTFQQRSVYDDIIKNGYYRLPREKFLIHADVENRYAPHRILEKYDRLIEKSGLPCAKEGTMPLWGWYKEDGGKPVTPEIYEGMFARARQLGYKHEEEPEMVVLFLRIPKEEVYLTNFMYWEFYLYSEADVGIKDFTGWTKEEKESYFEGIDEENAYFSRLDDIEGPVQVQGIFPEIRQDMIEQVLFEEYLLRLPTK